MRYSPILSLAASIGLCLTACADLITPIDMPDGSLPSAAAGCADPLILLSPPTLPPWQLVDGSAWENADQQGGEQSMNSTSQVERPPVQQSGIVEQPSGDGPELMTWIVPPSTSLPSSPCLFGLFRPPRSV